MAFTNFFTPTGHATLNVGNTSANVAIPAAGAPTSVRVHNAGPNKVAILIGASATAVTATTGVVMAPGTTEYFAIGAFINAIQLGGGPQNSSLFITAGT